MSAGRERSGIGTGDKSPSALAVNVNGVRVVIDQATITHAERRQVRAALAKMFAGTGVEPDGTDALIGSIWVVMRRTDPDLTLDAVSEAITFADIEQAEAVVDDSPEV